MSTLEEKIDDMLLRTTFLRHLPDPADNREVPIEYERVLLAVVREKRSDLDDATTAWGVRGSDGAREVMVNARAEFDRAVDELHTHRGRVTRLAVAAWSDAAVTAAKAKAKALRAGVTS